MAERLINYLRVISDKRITSVPIKVLRELRRKGTDRIPLSPFSRNKRRSAYSFFRFLHQWLSAEKITRHNDQWVLNSFTPPFPGPAFNQAFRNLLSPRRFSPISAFCAVTARCSYNCGHCSARGREKNEMTTEQWTSILKELRELGVSIVGFTGGEPLIRHDLSQLVETATRGGAETIVFSSGAIHGFDSLARLRDAGLWSLCISLDHHREEVHDRMRGYTGAFSNALKAIRHSKALGLYTMIGTVATRESVLRKEHREIFRLAQELGVDEMRIVEPMPCGKAKEQKGNYLLDEEMIRELRGFHREQNRRTGPTKVCAFNQIESPEVFGCAGGIQHLYIDSASNVCPCDFTPLGFGKCTEEPLSVIWDRMTNALGHPRRKCIIQHYHEEIDRQIGTGIPAPPELSIRIARKFAPEPLPDYYAMVTSENE